MKNKGSVLIEIKLQTTNRERKIEKRRKPREKTKRQMTQRFPKNGKEGKKSRCMESVAAEQEEGIFHLVTKRIVAKMITKTGN